MLESLGLAWDRDKISVSHEDEFVRVGMSVERKCKPKNLGYLGTWSSFLYDELAHGLSRERW